MKKIIALFIAVALYSINTNAQTAGCPDPAAINYDSTVTINNGSCTYNNLTLNPKLKYNLSTTLNETSGLIWWKNRIWSHNDSGNDPAFYAMKVNSNAVTATISVTNATNVDWEDIAQDDSFIYIGDFGNNAQGNRTDLKIYKIAKADVEAGNSVSATVINFSYNDQTDFTPKGNNNTNYDCEALIAYGDSLFLFSKDWVDNKTRLYKLPKTPGTFQAVNIGELNVQGLITGAEIIADKKVIVLTGYNAGVSPFIYLLYDFNGNNFLGANKRKVGLNESFTQVEGICAKSPTAFFVSNEKLSQIFINTPAKLQQLNLASLLNPYYNSKLKKVSQKTKTNLTPLESPY